MIFMAGVGLTAGSGILETLAASGIGLVLAGAAVTTAPVAVGYVFGRGVLRLENGPEEGRYNGPQLLQIGKTSDAA